MPEQSWGGWLTLSAIVAKGESVSQEVTGYELSEADPDNAQVSINNVAVPAAVEIADTTVTITNEGDAQWDVGSTLYVWIPRQSSTAQLEQIQATLKDHEARIAALETPGSSSING